jgi:hypothetical protein
LGDNAIELKTIDADRVDTDPISRKLSEEAEQAMEVMGATEVAKED